ncbi:hypothetical protein SEPCBS57363_003867 [Sporothrix epigloea]|uniref:Uncharacterized protein n=1 Tax=Sporothrix epigloea TaxID=1892477 RepID=A0ABP0DNX4_9PEZI
MCHFVTITWSCGHQLVSFAPCADAVTLEQGAEHEEADDKYMTCGVYYRPCEDMRYLTTRNPDSIPFCQYPSCVPNYWSCCQCQPLQQFGSLGGDESGKVRISRRVRLQRLAPTSTVVGCAMDLQLGDGVCGDDMLEELREGYGDPPSVIAVPCPSSMICQGCFAEEHVDEVEISPQELRECMAEGQDNLPLLPKETAYKGKTDCGHMRCDKCSRWRCCPCSCLCPYLIPAARRSCNVCLRSGCEAVDLLGLRERLMEIVAAERSV